MAWPCEEPSYYFGAVHLRDWEAAIVDLSLAPQSERDLAAIPLEGELKEKLEEFVRAVDLK